MRHAPQMAEMRLHWEDTMNRSTCLIIAALVGMSCGACSEKTLDDTRRDTRDATEKAGRETAAATKEIAGKTAEKTKEIAGEVVAKSQEIASATGAAMTDGWITTKVKAKFADETALKGSHIDVDTDNHVVTLRGTVLSAAAKARAAAIAGGTEGVTRVVDHLLVP
jgi:hyperosmotically inducible protein